MRNLSNLSLWSVLIAWFVTVAAVAPLETEAGSRHPYNETHAEVEYNPESGCLEVALRLDPLALEESLRLVADRPIDLDETKDVDDLIVGYLSDTFRVLDRGRPAPLRWVGKEIEGNDMWAYFELELANGPNRTVWENHVLFELDEEQRNTVSFTEPDPRRTVRRMVFDLDHPRVVLEDGRPRWIMTLRRGMAQRARSIVSALLERAARRALETLDRSQVEAVGSCAAGVAWLVGDAEAFREAVAPQLEGDPAAAARSLIGYARHLCRPD